ncbi:hypothetical protein CR513_14783, partial [Mucuna pruriens]
MFPQKLFPFSLTDKALEWSHHHLGRVHTEEPLDEAWKRFWEMLHSDLFTLNRINIDTACGGTIKKKHPNEAYAITKDMTSNTYHYSSSDRHVIRRLTEIHRVEIEVIMEKKLYTLIKQIEFIIQAQTQFLPSLLLLVSNIAPNLSWKSQHTGQAQNAYKSPPMQYQNHGQRQEEKRPSL